MTRNTLVKMILMVFLLSPIFANIFLLKSIFKSLGIILIIEVSNPGVPLSKRI